jgi:hypothetical protein
MSWYAIIPGEVLSRKDISANEKLLVGLIASLSYKEGHCFASNQYMGDCLGVSQSAVRSYLRNLEELDIVSRIIKKKPSGEVETREIRVTTPLSDLTPPSPTNIAYPPSDSRPPSPTDLSHIIRDNNKGNNKQINIEEKFEKFWEEYGKKVGKEKTRQKWIKLKENEKDEVLLSIPRYKIARPDPVYRKDPERYLSNRVWEDELPLSTNETKQSTEPINQEQFELTIPKEWQ